MPILVVTDKSLYTDPISFDDRACVLGRQVPEQVDFTTALSWLEGCEQTHELCRRTRNPRPPRRVLDLGYDQSQPTIRLLEDKEWAYRYATLSHWWGESQPLKLTRQTREQFLKEIRSRNLPRMFQDAITATRLLGLRYLWIDSLCILQDSKTDWEEQCAEMCRIYRDSYVTIAGPAASSCDHGFLHLRESLVKETFETSDGD